jgi:hypothetical protein
VEKLVVGRSNQQSALVRHSDSAGAQHRSIVGVNFGATGELSLTDTDTEHLDKSNEINSGTNEQRSDPKIAKEGAGALWDFTNKQCIRGDGVFWILPDLRMFLPSRITFSEFLEPVDDSRSKDLLFPDQ